MTHSYKELLYHIVWSTKYRNPLITEEIKPILLSFIKRKATELGCHIFALNCVNDHLHVLLYIPPSMAVSIGINHLKGASSREIKALVSDFGWQEGYGIFTLRRSDLSVVCDYIDRQE